MIQTHWYTSAASAQWSGSPINWSTDPIYVALVNSGYSPAQDTDQWWSAAQSAEITGTGYTAGGLQLMNTSVGTVVGSHQIPLLAASSTWNLATFTCRYAVIYKNTGNPNTSPLIGWVDFGGNESVASGTFQLAWDGVFGVLQLTAT